MKKLLTVIAALIIIAGVSEARDIKRMKASTKPLKLYRPTATKTVAKAAPTEATIQAYRIVLKRRVEACKLATEQAEAKLMAFELEAAERAGR